MKDDQFKDELSKEIYETTYKYGDETIKLTQKRVADDIASVEKDKEKWAKKFFNILEDFKFVPGGRIISNAGTKIKGTTYINCFTPDVDILTNNGFVKITDIKIGDKVLSHTGNWRLVKSTMKREYKGEVDTYDSSVLTSKLRCTPEHPFYQGNNEWVESKNNKKLVILDYKKDIDDRLHLIKKSNNGLSPINDISNENEKIHEIKNFIKSKEYYEGLVYNLSVDIDESYIVNNVIVHNCFVDGFTGKNQDSIGGIMETLKRQAYILKSEGGYGFCADVIRPRGGYIEGIANETPGAVKWLDNWNTQSDVITAGSGKKTENKNGKQKIRKGAQMVTMSCWHPDIEEFITAKQTSGKLDKFNMSCLITDAFMDAVLNNKEWNLIFPNFDEDKNYYNDNWDGNINKWIEAGRSVKVYKTFKDANELWDLIMKSTYNRNEPGVLFVDVMNRLNNLAYCEYISATNPCGEQILPIGGVCLLGNLNLTKFIKEDLSGWDYDKLKEVIPVAIRFMDNVNDLTYVPLEDQKNNLKNKRRIGLGFMGYGSALLIMKKRYGCPEALKMTDELMTFIANTAYQSSSDLALEKGSFLMFDVDKYLQSKFIANLSDETKEKIKKNGIRNSHLLSIQPTGNCVRKNTIIKTSEGEMTIDQIFKLNKININKSVKNRWYIPIMDIKAETIDGYNRITGMYINDKKDILSIKTNNDNLIEGTLEHKVLVKVSDKEAIWKNLGDLKVGDKILKKKI
jgi:ribonucleotide reductase alpha subunit